jgi:hypothetical protein
MKRTTLPPDPPRSARSQTAAPPIPSAHHRTRIKARSGDGKFKSPPASVPSRDREGVGQLPGDADDFTADTVLQPGGPFGIPAGCDEGDEIG